MIIKKDSVVVYVESTGKGPIYRFGVCVADSHSEVVLVQAGLDPEWKPILRHNIIKVFD